MTYYTWRVFGRLENAKIALWRYCKGIHSLRQTYPITFVFFALSLHQRNKSFNCRWSPLTESESRIKSLALERWGTILSPALIWHFDLCILLYHSYRPYAGLHKWGDVVGDMGYGAPPQYKDDLSSYGISIKDKTVAMYIINNWLVCYHSNYQRQIIMGYVTWGRHFVRNGLTTCRSINIQICFNHIQVSKKKGFHGLYITLHDAVMLGCHCAGVAQRTWLFCDTLVKITV